MEVEAKIEEERRKLQDEADELKKARLAEAEEEETKRKAKLECAVDVGDDSGEWWW